VAASRTVMIAGAGIGGLTAALAIAQAGFRVAIYDQAERLEEAGAGIQLSPNASRVLLALGLHDRLQPNLVVPEDLKILAVPSGRELARAPLGTAIAQRYGAPYWVIHRGDLQAALVAAVLAHPDIKLQLGTRIEEFAHYPGGVTIVGTAAGRSIEARGLAFVMADGLWSRLRRRLGDTSAPRFAEHFAWRALAPTEAVSDDLRGPTVHLWLSKNAHLVHYPVKGGRLINVVAIVRDRWADQGWNAPADRREVIARFLPSVWPMETKILLAAPERWHKWALYDRVPLHRWGEGPITMLGDAVHPMLPFLAQGGAMAIEDAAVLAHCLAAEPTDISRAMRSYERQRRARTARTQRAARHNATSYHLGGVPAFLRNMALVAMGGERLIRRYDWLYGWRPPEGIRAS
jgi:salicylate hydroxylase